jgi:hypothetical protein
MVVMSKTASIEMFSEEARQKLSPAAAAAMSEYLTNFHDPVFKENKDGETATIICVNCGSHLYSGSVMDALFSTFDWGIVHGEGLCTKCGWNYRMYHSVKCEGEEAPQFTLPLAHRSYTDASCEVEVVPKALSKENPDDD